ncbi:hypothetical protein BV20DRAFT_1025831 [Pilatotrama ljubarskyi]|nr:hypothetical protein BV20DRAFT_1025831 [Pilatotrama ljubarskyi]
MTAADVLLTLGIVATILQHLDLGPLPDKPEPAEAPAAQSEPHYHRWMNDIPALPHSRQDLKDEPEVGPRHDDKKALARSARVCHAVSGPALDTLYKRVDDFRHLLCTLDFYDRKTCMFRDSITQTEWTKFQTYADRVREVHLRKINAVHASVWIALTRLCPNGPLLPRLERLTGLTIDSLSPCYTMLFSHTLRHMDIRVDGMAEESAIRVVMQAAFPSFASLRTMSVNDLTSAIELYYAEKRTEVVPFWSARQLRTLDVVHAATVTIETIRSLASMAHLHTLRLNIEEMPNPVLLENVQISGGFPSLRDLTLKGCLGDVTAFLAATRPHALAALAIEVPDLCRRSLDPLYAALATSGSRSTLRAFRAAFACPTEAADRRGRSCTLVHFPRGTKLLAPLRAFAGLRAISLRADNTGYHLADADLVEVADADAWRDLVALEIEATQRADVQWYGPAGIPAGLEDTKRDYPTLKTVCAFAETHARLERLVLPSIDLDARPDVQSVPLLRHPLKHFGVSEMDTSVPLFEFAVALDGMFPRLELEDARGFAIGGSPHNRKPEARSAGEEALRLLLLALQTGRAQGQARVRVGEHGQTGPAGLAGETNPGGKASDIRLILQGRYLRAPARHAPGMWYGGPGLGPQMPSIPPLLPQPQPQPPPRSLRYASTPSPSPPPPGPPWTQESAYDVPGVIQ